MPICGSCRIRTAADDPTGGVQPRLVERPLFGRSRRSHGDCQCLCVSAIWRHTHQAGTGHEPSLERAVTTMKTRCKHGWAPATRYMGGVEAVEVVQDVVARARRMFELPSR